MLKWQHENAYITGIGNYFFFFVTDQIDNIFGFAGQSVSFTTIQLCRCSAKAAIDNK